MGERWIPVTSIVGRNLFRNEVRCGETTCGDRGGKVGYHCKKYAKSTAEECCGLCAYFSQMYSNKYLKYFLASFCQKYSESIQSTFSNTFGVLSGYYGPMYTKDILSISPQYMPQLVCPNSKLMYISKIHFENLWSPLGHSILKEPQKSLKMYFEYFQNTFGKMMLKSISNTYLNTFGRSMHKGHNILLLYFWHTFDNYILTFTLWCAGGVMSRP